MASSVRELQPRTLWNHFADLNSVPRPSKKEGRIIEFMRNFGESLGLPTHVDETGNVIIKKPATPGMENLKTIVVQSHLDMVHQKNADTAFDFDNEGIRMVVDGDWVKAAGTTLGADNGIGVAAIMTLLSSDDIPHPALEALFTIDEETGMTGAQGLKGGLLHGSILLNLDTEDDHELTIGCAGGLDVSASGTYSQTTTPAGWKAYRISVRGLTGGHSGMDIHLGRGNANKLMNRLLLGASRLTDLRVNRIDGGGLRNAIPRESFAVVAVAPDKADTLQQYIQQESITLYAEYAKTDPDIVVGIEPCELPATVADKTFLINFLRAVYACPNGIYRMSPDIKDLVQSSNNLARVLVDQGNFSVLCLTRGSVDSEKMDVAEGIRAAFELTGAEVAFSGGYPGWAPRPDAGIITLMRNLYKELYHDEPAVNACHAGLECGILGTNYPGMEMISFGPNIRGAHSPDEKVQVSSVQKFWDFLLETLKRIPQAV